MDEYVVDLTSLGDLAAFSKLIEIGINKEIEIKAFSFWNATEINARSFEDISEISTMPIRVKIITDNEEELKKFMLICNRFIVNPDKWEKKEF